MGADEVVATLPTVVASAGAVASARCNHQYGGKAVHQNNKTAAVSSTALARMLSPNLNRGSNFVGRVDQKVV